VRGLNGAVHDRIDDYNRALRVGAAELVQHLLLLEAIVLDDRHSAGSKIGITRNVCADRILNAGEGNHLSASDSLRLMYE
jgi:hypothetical protein